MHLSVSFSGSGVSGTTVAKLQPIPLLVTYSRPLYYLKEKTKDRQACNTGERGSYFMNHGSGSS